MESVPVHLNHGSFGLCPRAVLDAASVFRERLEAAPMRFFVLDWQRELDTARAALARFVRAPGDRVVFVPNATSGVALALNSVAQGALGPGDEIVTTDHAYRACKNQLVRLAESRGARVVVVPVALPFDPDATVAAIAGAITPRTRLALLDHITSPTGVVMPIERIVPRLAERAIQVVIDGAHAPGQIDLDVGALLALGVTWYAGNNHKWLCAPKSSGFLVTTTPLRPLVTSHGASPDYGPPNRLHAELDWTGTSDPSPHLAVPAAIAEVARLAGGSWPALYARNHALAIAMRGLFVEAGATIIAPETSLGAMAAVPIETSLAPDDLQRRLLETGWEVPIIPWPAPSGPLLRVCAHYYNDIGQVEALIRHLHSLGVRLR